MTGKHAGKERISPVQMITRVSPIFKSTLSQPQLKNTVLLVIAIAMAKAFRLNELSRHLPIAVKSEKIKQKRLSRFIKSVLPIAQMQESWLRFVLQKVYRKPGHQVLLLIDETKLIGRYKAIVAAIPFRQRSIVINFLIYSDSEIRSMKYKSHNTLIMGFCKRVHAQALSALPKRTEPLLIFDRGFARAKYLIRPLKSEGIRFLIRVCKNVGITVKGEVKNLKQIRNSGFYPNIVYHQTQRIKLNLYVISDDQYDEPMFIVSNSSRGMAMYLCYKRRMQVEQGFRDLKSTFGFKKLRLKIIDKQRLQLLWLMLCVSYGMLMLIYQKSGYRWAKKFNHPKKNMALIWVIKHDISIRYNGFLISPLFTLPFSTADIQAPSYGQCFS